MRKIIQKLSSVRLFFFLSGAILVACILGGLIPQGGTGTIASPGLARVIAALGLGDLFTSLWFNVLLVLLGVNLMACSLSRLSALRRRPGVFVTHVGVLLILIGAALRGVWGEKGFLGLTVGTPAAAYVDAQGQKASLPFDALLKKFSLSYWREPAHRVLMVEGGHEKIYEIGPGRPAALSPDGELRLDEFYPDFVLSAGVPGSRSPEPRNPALRLTWKKAGAKEESFFLFQNHPEFGARREPAFYYEYAPGQIRQYESLLSLTAPTGETVEKTIWVNKPLRFKGFTLYQASYDPAHPDFSGIQVARDPGIPLVYAGFLLLMVGLFWAFYGRRGAASAAEGVIL